MKFENTETFNWRGALRGMRNPMNSWSKSDSRIIENKGFIIGENDLTLARKLIKAGTGHRKFLRQIFICVDITAPLYWWKQFDTYKVGTVANSCSTMHKLTSTPITRDCFEKPEEVDIPGAILNTVKFLEYLRIQYNKTKDKKYWYILIYLLPEGWLQKRTITMNYEVAYNMYKQRKNHILTEWHALCEWAETLPYFREFFIEN